MDWPGCRKALLAIAVLAGAVALYCCSPTDYRFWPKCPVRLITGLSCPACGIQRALHALLNGHIAQAAAYNYYLIYALPYTAALIAARVMPQSKARQKARDILESRTAIGIYIVSFCLWFIIRNILNI